MVVTKKAQATLFKGKPFDLLVVSEECDIEVIVKDKVG